MAVIRPITNLFPFFLHLQQSKFKKSRTKTSTRCNCQWRVRLKKNPDELEGIEITTMALEHTNGCCPSLPPLRRQVRENICLTFHIYILWFNISTQRRNAGAKRIQNRFLQSVLTIYVMAHGTPCIVVCARYFRYAICLISPCFFLNSRLA